MTETSNDGPKSSEDGIRRVSADPILNADGIGGLGGEIYIPPTESGGSDSTVGTDADVKGHQAHYDEDDCGSPTTVTSR